MNLHSTRHWRPLGLILLVLAGLAIAIWLPLELATLLDWGHRITDRPLAMLALVVLMAVLFTFALPGSLCLWLIAPFQPPVLATALLVTGSACGALGAYGLAARVGSDWRPDGLGGRIMKLLAERGDFLTQCALRILPGFPHSILNYAGGVLRLPLAGFIAATLLGLSVKWGVYASAVHGVVEAAETGDVVSATALLPLLLLTLLLLLGAWARQRVTGGQDR